MISI
ncbi:UNVERIFIED_CONTAM: hypothetical protein GTU68_007428 [Idotea baltica]|jgi:probable addiction module antidote protein/putative addiction module killer protein